MFGPGEVGSYQNHIIDLYIITEQESNFTSRRCRSTSGYQKYLFSSTTMTSNCTSQYIPGFGEEITVGDSSLIDSRSRNKYW